MTIASEITKLNTNLTNAYTAVDDKGGTLPQAQNFDNLATAISSIPSGGGGGYSELPSYQVENGVVSRRSITLTNDNFSNITNVNDYGFYCCYSYATSLTGTVNMPNLISIGNYGLREAFSHTNITSVDLSNLSEISVSYGMTGAFYNCSNLVSVRFPKLSLLTASRAMGGNLAKDAVFGYCTNLQDVYFNSLTTLSFSSYTNQLQNLLYNTGSSVTHTIHFPSNLESTISGLTGYPNFGGTSGYVVCAFDLPATE